MAKTLILSQEQLNEIMGGDLSYLDGLDREDTHEGDMPEYMGHNQVTANSPISKPKTGKDLSDKMGEPQNPYTLSTRTHVGYMPGPALGESYTKREFENLVINEINNGLTGQTMTAVYNNTPLNPQNTQNIQGNESVLAKHKTEAAQSGNRAAYNAISNVLKRNRDIANKRKENMKKLGIGTTPQGKAHTPKPKFNTYLNNN